MTRIAFAAPLVLIALLAAESSAQQPLTTVRVASGLTRPVSCTAPAGDLERLYVIEQNGARIRIIKNGVLQATPFMTVPGVAAGGNEQGLLGLAFHPDFQQNGKFYLNYTGTAGAGDTFIVEYTATSPDVGDPGSAVTLLTYNQPQTNHNGGGIAFGADGKLYIGSGDGGNANDTGAGHVAGGNAQSGANLLGKMLRLDVDIAAPYIPADNPFVGNGSIRDEIWSLGLRNPWRFSFDRATGDMYIGDVGQNAREEVDFEAAGNGGLNYGWRCMEGFNCTGLSGCTCNMNVVLPVHDYAHNLGCSITGGYVYRGCDIPDLDGTYFFGDFCSGRIWSFEYDAGTGTVLDFTNRTVELQPGGGMAINTISSFGEDANGEIYICDFGPSFGGAGDGEIYKIVPAGGVGIKYCNGKFNSLFCLPFLTTSGSASATSTAPYIVTGNDILQDEFGFLLYSFTGRSNLSFHGGTLCIKAPIKRLLPPKSSGSPGTGFCPGELSTNFNKRIQSGADPSLTVGARVNAQYIYRDPADAFGDGLTDGVEFLICD